MSARNLFEFPRPQVSRTIRLVRFRVTHKTVQSLDMLLALTLALLAEDMQCITTKDSALKLTSSPWDSLSSPATAVTNLSMGQSNAYNTLISCIK